jgi:ABC-2 type transport system permease protein
VVRASNVFRVRQASSADVVRQLVADETVTVGLILETEFDPAGGHPAEMVIDEGSAPQVRGPVEGALRELVRTAVYGEGWTTPILVASSPPGVRRPIDGNNGFQVAITGNAVLFGFFIALTCALSFVEERRTGTLRRVMAAPVSRRLFVLAKLVPFVVIGAIQMAFLFGLGAILFGLRVGGSVVALILLCLAVVLCATSLGLLIASFSGTEKQVGGIGSICLLVMGLAGGAMVPRMLMPAALQQLGLCTPQAWALDGYYELLVRDGASLADVAPQIAAVTAFAVAFAIVGALRFRFER